MNEKLLSNIRYDALNALYWLAGCAISGFAVVYLLSEGFSNVTAGLVVSLANLATVVLQPLAGRLADRSKRFSLKQITMALFAVGLLLSLLLLIPAGPVWLFALYFLEEIVIIGAQPLVNALGVQPGSQINFGFARGCGSLSYAISSAVMGVAVTAICPSIVLYVAIACWALNLLVLGLFPKTQPKGLLADASEGAEAQTGVAQLRGFFRRYKVFMLVMLGVFFLQMPYMGAVTFMIHIAERVGGDSSVMGMVNGIAALMEFPMMACYSRIRRRFSCEAILLFAAVVFVVKHGCYLLVGSVPALYCVCLLQTLSFALYMPCIVEYATLQMQACDQVLGQTVIMGVTSLATGISALTGGFLFEAVGTDATLLVWEILTIVSAVVFFVALHDKLGKGRAGAAAKG